MRRLFILCTLGLIGCGGGPIHTIGIATPAAGAVSMENSEPDTLMSGLIFENQGTEPITIDQIHVVLASGHAIDTQFGIGVQAGDSATYVFDTQSPQRVASVAFMVHGTTEQLVVLSTQETGISPTAGSAAKCVGGTAGQPSPEGGCCSEWIPCAKGLDCQADGPVYPGSVGICTKPTGPRCVGGTAGQPSPKGGCCSEWIPCAKGLDCQADGPVYPGSAGICVQPPA